MTRDRVILMLLATGPASRAELTQDTGWGIEETKAVIGRLVEEGTVVAFPWQGNNQRGAAVLCLPQVREQVLEQRRLEDCAKNTARVHRARARAGV